MDNKDFNNELKQGLESLDREQKIRFAWLCGVRTLPFLGGKGDFEFWRNDEERQQFIYDILRVLDEIVAYTYTYASPATMKRNHRVVASAIDSAKFSVNIAGLNRNDSDEVAAAAAVSVASAAAAAFAANASAASASASANHAYSAAAKFGMDLEPCILSDLTSAKSPKKRQKLYRTDWYGEIWDNFQIALEKEGCAYWGKLYKKIFDDGFILDLDALEKRLYIPNEIKEQGAAAVADYLEELEKGATRLNEARIIILGEKGAGKTCIARKLVDPNAEMTTDDESTAGVDTTLWKLEEDNINVRIWDFAGHTVTHAVHQFFLSERCLYLLVYDGRTEDRNRLIYWLDHMKIMVATQVP